VEQSSGLRLEGDPLKGLFNAICAECEFLKPKCAVVLMRRKNPRWSQAAERWLYDIHCTLCSDCRKRPEYQGRFRLDPQHKSTAKAEDKP
jgi:hypothetical protein